MYYRCVLNWLDVFKRNIKPSLFQSLVGKMSVLLLFESTDHNRVVKMSKYRKLLRCCCLTHFPPAGQLCAAATSPRCLEWTRKVGAHSSGSKNPAAAEMRSCDWEQPTVVDTTPSFLHLLARLCTQKNWLFALKEKFCAYVCFSARLLPRALVPSTSTQRRHIVCDAARQCGVRLHTVRWGDAGTERSSVEQK